MTINDAKQMTINDAKQMTINDAKQITPKANDNKLREANNKHQLKD
jgi:hypothetical protein